MNGQDVSSLLAAARDLSQELPARVHAIEELAHLQRKDLAIPLRELWDRPRPPAEPLLMNYDPIAAERVVDLYLIYALSTAGDFSLLHEIATHVAQSGNVLSGPTDEHLVAAKVIRAMGRLQPIEEVIAVASRNDPRQAANAVRTLQFLDLPAPPTGGSVAAFPQLAAPVSFTIHRLREELEAVARLSAGRIELSQSTQDWAALHDYNRGEVNRQNTNLAAILTQELDKLDLAYAVTPRDVVICTFPEAGLRWQQQWPAYSKRLAYEPASHAWRARDRF